MKKIKLISLFVILLILFIGCSKPGGNPSNREEYKTTVRGIEIEKEQFISSIRLSGRIEAQKNVDLSFKSGGRVGLVNVKEGDSILKNSIIARLEQIDYYARLLQAQATFDQAEADYNRMEKLFEQSLISQQAFQGTETQYHSAKAGLMLAQSSYGGAVIKAPFDGIITYRNIDEVEMASPGVPYFGIVDIDSVLIKMFVSSEKISQINLGTRVFLTVDAYNDIIFEGVISKIFPSADPTTGKFVIEVKIPNEEKKLMPGMIAVCNVELSRRENVIIVPMKSVSLENNQSYVYTVSNGQAVRTDVEVDDVSDSIAVISEGLYIGDTVIVAGVDYIEDGSKILCIMERERDE